MVINNMAFLVTDLCRADTYIEHVDHAEEVHEELHMEPYIVAVDVGTTSLRSHIYNKHGCIKASSSKKVCIFCSFRSVLFHNNFWSLHSQLLCFTAIIIQ